MGKLTTMREANRIRTAGEAPARVLLVGELNPYGGPDSNALVPWPAGCAGHRMQSRILGLPEETYLAIHRRNLCRGTWSIMRAREAAIATLQQDTPWSLIVLLGRKVADAYGNILPFTTAARFGWVDADTDDVLCVEALNIGRKRITLLALPHPSGRNASSWAGDAIARAREALRLLAPDVPWGSL